jgi:hypothetical protein
MFAPNVAPPGIGDRSAIWVPVGRFFWGWDAEAAWSGPQNAWIPSTPAAQDMTGYQSPADNSYFPTYRYSVLQVIGSWA